MYSKTIALTGVFAALAAAVPMARRDTVWVTETEEAVVTVAETTTVWVDPTPTFAPTSSPTASHYGHQHSHKKQTQVVHSTIIVHPSPSAAPSEAASSSSSAAPVIPASSLESTSVYVAPTPSSTYVAPTTSTSVYVAPTTSTSHYVAPTTSSVYIAPTTSSVYTAPTTSSVYTAPTTSSVYVAPTTTSVYVAPTTSAAPATTSAAAPAASSASSSSSSGLSYGLGAAGTDYTGDLTYFAVGLGACGLTSTEQDKMVAISEVIFDSYLAEAGGNPNKNPLCGKYVTITGADGSPYKAQIMDRCPGCDEGSLDLPQAFFNTVTTPAGSSTPADGRAKGMKWSFD